MKAPRHRQNRWDVDLRRFIALNMRLILIIFISTLTILELSLDSGSDKKTKKKMSRLNHLSHASVSPEYELAQRESLGFFTDIIASDWQKLKRRAKEKSNHVYNDPIKEYINKPHAWYQNHYEPDFTCMHELRMGGMGDGSKWVCDPHRIKKDNCLMYSIGSFGDFKFEMAILDEFPDCEVHTFDMDSRFVNSIPEKYVKKIKFHKWGLANKETIAHMPKGLFKTLPEIVRELNHEGRTIDIFKIDCEKCEWFTYKDWFATDVNLRQILVEVHEVADVTNDFFERMHKEGYVIFHKEPNTIGCKGDCIEYAFLKLGASFFH